MTELRADCAKCVGLCCVALGFKKSFDFAITKPAGKPCPNLLADHRCGIHDSLPQKGFRGCTTYDCFGAGQRVAQETFAGRDWRSTPEVTEDMFGAFQVMRDLHEILWYLTEVAARVPAMRDEAERAIGATEELARTVTGDLDVGPHRERVSALFLRASAAVRGTKGKEYRDAVLIGRDLSTRDFRRANLRGAYLTGADLAGADLRLADLLGCELRGANVAGADLSTALFLTQAQVNATRGDERTRLPNKLDRPAHYSGS